MLEEVANGETVRKIFVVAAVGLVAGAGVLASSLTATAVPTCTAEWDGGAGTDRWDDAANWQGDALPAPSDTACISDTGLASVVVPSSFTAEVNFVVAGEALVVNGTLTLDGTADTSVVDSLTLAGGTVNHRRTNRPTDPPTDRGAF